MVMDLEIRHLQLVAAVAEVGSLTRAGDRLHLTQSALSHQLRDIESRLGTALFLRVGKRLVLTPAGERLPGCARDIPTRWKPRIIRSRCGWPARSTSGLSAHRCAIGVSSRGGSSTTSWWSSRRRGI